MREHSMRSATVGVALLVTALAACSGSETPATPADAAPSAAASPAAPAATPAVPAGFSVDRLPMSTAALGPFPYFTLPTGYVTKPGASSTKAFARFPFRVGGKDHWVEGMFHTAAFVAEPGKTFSVFEVQKNLDAVIAQMGGQKVEEGIWSPDVVKAWGPEITQGFNPGVDPAAYMYPKATSTVWVVRRADGNIWVYMTANENRGGYVVGKEGALQQTSALLTADALKQAIDATGRVAVQVNFETDRTEILPDSQPQIDQIVALMTQTPDLRLAINGHTDDTGTPAHNQSLSEGRAASVVAALVAKGIPAASLAPKGLGATQPVADNGTEAGKARNRRVELVKL